MTTKAEHLADELFTNGQEQEASHLCLYKNTVYLGGWSKPAILAKLPEFEAAVRVEERERVGNLLRDIACTCGHRCPSQSERMDDPDVICVHEDWCAMSPPKGKL